MKLDNMVLYCKPGCPFCHRVLDFMTANDIQIETVNSTDPQHRQELLDMNGTTQSPCLVIDGKPMLESADIIAYLKGLL